MLFLQSMTKIINSTINVHGKLLSLATPQVMGILNVTPDSFFAGSRKQTELEIAQRANQIVAEGGTIIDVGAFSTRPGADEVSMEEEMNRLRKALPIIRKEQPDVALSVDTFRPEVAQMAVEEYGADIINDVSEGGITGIVDTPLMQNNDDEYPAIFRMMGRLKVPYILMSVQKDVHDMLMGFSKEVQQLRDLGVKDIILDPGFGFASRQPVVRGARNKVVLYGQLLVEHAALKNYADKVLDLKGILVKVKAAYRHAARGFFKHGAKNIYRRRLAGSVHAQKGEERALLDRKADVAHSLNVFIVFYEVVDFNGVFHVISS